MYSKRAIKILRLRWEKNEILDPCLITKWHQNMARFKKKKNLKKNRVTQFFLNNRFKLKKLHNLAKNEMDVWGKIKNDINFYYSPQCTQLSY